jgi:hypothetical protein
MISSEKMIFIDPSYPAYCRDRLFDVGNPVLNRDGTLMPYERLRSEMHVRGIPVHTADYLLQGEVGATVNDYYSLGTLSSFPRLTNRSDVRLRGFLIMEPPVVAPKLYRALPKLTRHFERVFLHNTEGDGYSLKGVDRTKLRPLYWPQPYPNTLDPYFNNRARKNRIVVINANHIPRSLHGQLYGMRIAVMARLAKLGVVDLYGRGWEQWWSHRSMWPPYWRNYKALMSIYHGACDSKYEVLSGYRFSLCFENMTMRGYVTEKLFDCLYAGTIPLYLGAENIDDLIPSDAFVNCRHFSSWEEMSHKVMAMSDYETDAMREAGRAFILSKKYLRYHDSLLNIVND